MSFDGQPGLVDHSARVLGTSGFAPLTKAGQDLILRSIFEFHFSPPMVNLIHPQLAFAARRGVGGFASPCRAASSLSPDWQTPDGLAA